MPTISPLQGGGVIRWDRTDWLAGLTPDWGFTGLFDHADYPGFGYMVAMDPTRRPGYLYPGQTPSDATGVASVAAILKNGVAVGDEAYAIEAGALLHQITVATSTITTTGSWPHTITPHGHSTAIGSDVAIYYIGSTKYLFYSWSDNTDGDVGRFDLTSTFDDDWMSTVPASGAVLAVKPHPMIVNNRNMLIIADGNQLHQLDGQSGANGTFSANRLTLPSDYIVTSMTKTSNYTVIFAYESSSGGTGTFNRGECAAFFWDENSDSPTFVVPIDGSYVNGGFTWKGSPGCFVRGRTLGVAGGKKSKMLIGDAAGFRPLAHLVDEIPGHGGVEVTDEAVFWICDGATAANPDAQLYKYGSGMVGVEPRLYRIAELAGTTGEGMLRNFFSDTLLASSGATTTGGCEVLDSGYGDGEFYMTLAHPPFNATEWGVMRRVKVYWADATGTAPRTLDLKIHYNGGDTTKLIINDLGTVTTGQLITEYTTTTDETQVKFKGLGIHGVYSNGGDSSKKPPIIQAVEIYYDTIKITG